MNNMGKTFSSMVMAAGIAFIGACGSSGGGGDSGSCGAAGTSCVSVAGTWSTTEQVSASSCGSAHTDYNTYTVTQTGCTLAVTSGAGTFNGVVNGSQICWTGSYASNGGTTTITSLSLTVDQSGNSLQGTSNWKWSSGLSSCSGSTQVTGTKS